MENLPKGMVLRPGEIRINFDTPNQALEKLPALAMAVGNDQIEFEAYRGALSGDRVLLSAKLVRIFEKQPEPYAKDAKCPRSQSPTRASLRTAPATTLPHQAAGAPPATAGHCACE
jgi:hypothetical protein